MPSMHQLGNKAESPFDILQKWGEQLGVKVVSFAHVLDLGKSRPRKHTPPFPGDVYALSYTSGTTGSIHIDPRKSKRCHDYPRQYGLLLFDLMQGFNPASLSLCYSSK